MSAVLLNPGTLAQVTTVPTSEVFGPVFQGEGPHAGRRCWFLRLGLCNLHCSWCDTKYTWDHTQYDIHAECPPKTAAELVDMLPHQGLVILSGGEPLIHQDNPALQQALAAADALEVHVETNGTLAPNAWARERVAHFTVSPKLADQGDPEHRRVRPGVLSRFAELAHEGRAIFKVVVRDAEEVRLASEWFTALDVPERGQWVMPEGIDRDSILSRALDLGDLVAELGMNLSLRHHVLVYGGVVRAR